MLPTTRPDVNPTIQMPDREMVAPDAPRPVRRLLARRLQASLTDLLRWQRQHVDLVTLLDAVPDGRDAGRTQIPLPAILLAVLCLFWLNLRSVHALEDRLQHSPALRQILRQAGWNAAISEDTFADALARLDWTCLRPFLHRQARREMKHWGAYRYLDSELGARLQTVGAAHLAAKALVAVDGHELFVSERRCCPECQTREVTKKRNGQNVPVTEYFHVAVFAQWVGVHPAIILDFEPIRPGEGELTAAYRLVERLHRVYGGLVGIVVADAAYDCEPFRFRVQQAGWHVVLRHKDERRDPGRTGRRTLDRHDPHRQRPNERHREGKRHYGVWDVPVDGRRYIEVHRTAGEKTQVGACVTSLQSKQAPAVAIAMIMETRWWIENTGFHELAGTWALDRAFVHVGRPAAAWAFVVLALTAFNAFQAYVYRHLKLDPTNPERTLLDLRRDLFETLGAFSRPGLPRARAPCPGIL